jgi:hypothetical protein
MTTTTSTNTASVKFDSKIFYKHINRLYDFWVVRRSFIYPLLSILSFVLTLFYIYVKSNILIFLLEHYEANSSLLLLIHNLLYYLRLLCVLVFFWNFWKSHHLNTLNLFFKCYSFVIETCFA